MKEAIGGAWLFQIVIVMVLLFSGFLAISLNYSKAFKVKNGVINIIQRQNGVHNLPTANIGGSQQEIIDYLRLVGYRNSGQCVTTVAEIEWIGLIIQGEAGTWNPPQGSPADRITNSGNQRFNLCIYRTAANGAGASEQGIADIDLYRVEAFFRLDIPVVSQLFNLKLSGTTKPIMWPSGR